MSDTVEVINATVNAVLTGATLAVPGGGLQSIPVPEEGMPLVAFLEAGKVDYAKSQSNGVSYIDGAGRTLGPDSIVSPNDVVSAASNRDNG